VAATFGTHFVRSPCASTLEFPRDTQNTLDKMDLHFVSYCRFSRKKETDFTTESTEGHGEKAKCLTPSVKLAVCKAYRREGTKAVTK
jgi:hypothetical protein